jgi:hypothetical protein
MARAESILQVMACGVQNLFGRTPATLRCPQHYQNIHASGLAAPISIGGEDVSSGAAHGGARGRVGAHLSAAKMIATRKAANPNS